MRTKINKNLSKLRIFIILTSLASLLVGIYLMVLIMSPSVIIPFSKELTNISATDNRVEIGSMKEEFIEKNWLIIPKIDLFEEIFEGGEEVLSLGVYHKFPEMGNPEKVGNFLLTAHRQELGLTVDSTRRKSPFYSIDKLKVNDEIQIVWNHVMYIYVVKDVYIVQPDQVEIEKQTEKSRLTLYTCTLGGSDDGRIVIEAFPK